MRTDVTTATDREVALLDAAAAREGDADAVARGSSWSALMERAAGHLARGVVEVGGGAGYGLRVAVLAGRGNNGGDGWACARRLRAWGAQAWVVAPGGIDADLPEDAASNRSRWIEEGGRTGDGTAALDEALDWCEVAVDALLGTGISGAPRGDIATATAALLRAHGRGTTVVACDIPSGVNADDGSAPDGSVFADLTVTFGGVKRGLVLHPGAAHAGRIVVGELGAQWSAPVGSWRALTAAGARPSSYTPDTDKRDRGVVLVVGGSLDQSGAAAMSAAAALRAGAGLVTAAVPASARPIVAAHHPAMMTLGLDDRDGRVGAGAAEQLSQQIKAADVVAAGPGLGHHGAVRDLIAMLRAGARRLVLDADGLNVHRDDPSALADHDGDLVLTPHVRELQRIGGGADPDEAWAHRAERVPELARRYRATIVCKGPGSIVAAPDGRVWVTPTGGPSLGTGGTGDVLTGMIAAAIASADDVPLAVAQAVWWHGLAGQVAGLAAGGRAAATDLLDHLPAVLAGLVGVEGSTRLKDPFGVDPVLTAIARGRS